jgi:hypothetical protein
MKKSILILSTLVVALSTTVSANKSTGTSTSLQGVYMSYSMLLPIYMKYDDLRVKGDATNAIVEIPKGMGTVKFQKSGDKFSDVVYVDAAGNTTRLVPVTAFRSNAGKLNCRKAGSNTLFESTDGSICMCITKSPVVAGASAPLTVSLALPVVQSTREGAPKTSTN